MTTVDASRDRVSRVSIVLADDHPVVRSGLRRLLEAEPDLEVVAEAARAEDAFRHTRGHRPSVLMLDLSMPGRPSLQVIPEIRHAVPDTAIVVLTMHEDPALARAALRAGAAGYVLKDAADTELLHAVRRAATGEIYLSPRLGARLAAAPPTVSQRPDGLSKRELEVLRLIALGHTNAEIAAQLGLSVRTIDSHREHIHSKIGCPNRADLVRYAREHSLLAPHH